LLPERRGVAPIGSNTYKMADYLLKLLLLVTVASVHVYCYPSAYLLTPELCPAFCTEQHPTTTKNDQAMINCLDFCHKLIQVVQSSEGEDYYEEEETPDLTSDKRSAGATGRKSKYLRMGRSSEVVRRDETGPYRRPHYLRIGRAEGQASEALDKRSYASRYVRIGRPYDATLQGETEGVVVDAQDAELMKRNQQRVRPQQYMRIGKRAE